MNKKQFDNGKFLTPLHKINSQRLVQKLEVVES